MENPDVIGPSICLLLEKATDIYLLCVHIRQAAPYSSHPPKLATSPLCYYKAFRLYEASPPPGSAPHNQKSVSLTIRGHHMEKYRSVSGESHAPW